MKTKLDNKRSPLRFYLIIAFIEGAAVMVCELLSARMIAPYYGGLQSIGHNANLFGD